MTYKANGFDIVPLVQQSMYHIRYMFKHHHLFTFTPRVLDSQLTRRLYLFVFFIVDTAVWQLLTLTVIIPRAVIYSCLKAESERRYYYSVGRCVSPVRCLLQHDPRLQQCDNTTNVGPPPFEGVQTTNDNNNSSTTRGRSLFFFLAE